jgi:phage terminase large subunit GpA-like protein
VVEKFLNARAAARLGDIEPLKSFINDECGEPWEDSLGVIEDYGFLEARKRDYDFDEPWPEERRRFMFADKQEKDGGYFPWVIRSFGPFGKSRLVAYGEARTYAELEHVRASYRVARVDAIIDSGFDTQDVYRFCLANGWKAFKGDQVPFYLERVRDPKHPGQYRTVRQIWRKTQAVVYNAKTKMRIAVIPLFTFASDSAKDGLAAYMRGLVGDWTIARKVGRDYLREVTAERREEVVDGRGQPRTIWKRVCRDNHKFDCEVGIYVAQSINEARINGLKKPGAAVDVAALANGERQSTTVNAGADSVGGGPEQTESDNAAGWNSSGPNCQ